MANNNNEVQRLMWEHYKETLRPSIRLSHL